MEELGWNVVATAAPWLLVLLVVAAVVLVVAAAVKIVLEKR